MLPCLKKCAYRKSIPGDAHSSCCFKWKGSGLLVPKCSSSQAMKWFNFPYNYDPLWGPDECPAFSTEQNKEKVVEQDPLSMLISLLSNR